MCGACTVRVDGVVVRGCLMLAVQCDGARVETIEGVSDSGEIADLQERLRAAQRAAMRLLHARHAADRAGAAASTAACRAATLSARICPAITAAAPATRRSSTRSKRWRRRARNERLMASRMPVPPRRGLGVNRICDRTAIRNKQREQPCKHHAATHDPVGACRRARRADDERAQRAHRHQVGPVQHGRRQGRDRERRGAAGQESRASSS